jgi:hypothetical protein
MSEPRDDLVEQTLAGAVRSILQGLVSVQDLARAQATVELPTSYLACWTRQLREVLLRLEER